MNTLPRNGLEPLGSRNPTAALVPEYVPSTPSR